MKKRYMVKVRKVKTNQFRHREISLTDEEAEKLLSKLDKEENGYVITQIYPIFSYEL